MDAASFAPVAESLAAGGGIAPESAWFGLAFSLGLVHALDADHVMALSVLATEDPAERGGARAGLRWSAGHGAVLLASGAVLFAVGETLPIAWQEWAERLVGVVMIALGLRVLMGLARAQSHLHFHTHDGLPPHAHWHSHADLEQHPAREHHHHDHTATWVGALHGLAGSAPVLALLPVAARSPAAGLAYLLLFGLGVALAMALVSGLLGRWVHALGRSDRVRALSRLRAASALGSVLLGGWLAVTA